MTRNSAQTPDSDDPWGQLEADLFGVEVGKEHTAHERVASEELLDVPPQASIVIPKPLEDDDFGDFGAGLVEELAPAPRISRRSESSAPAAKASAQSDRSSASERPARADRARKPERTEEAAPAERLEKPAERLEKPERPARSERSAPSERLAKPVEPVEPPPAKSAGSVAAKAGSKKLPKDDFVDFDFDDGPTDEDLDASIDDDVDTVDEVEAKTPPSPEDDPYWDALANWNWQEDDRSSKPRDSDDRSRPATSSSRGDRGPSRGRSDRGRSDRSSADRSVADRAPVERPLSERPSAPSRESRASSAPEERPAERTPAARRSGSDRDRSDRERTPEKERVDPVDVPRSVSPALSREPEGEEVEESIDVSPRRRDRRRSRRQGPAATTPETPKTISLNALDPDFEPADEAWPQEVPESRAAVSDPRARIVETDLDFDEPVIDEDVDTADSEESAEEAEEQPRRKRGRRRRRRPDRPDSAKAESSVDEDLKHLEGESFDAGSDEDLDGKPIDVEGEEEESAEDRAKRPRRRRRRGGRSDRPERPAAVPAARVEPDLDIDEEDDLEEDPFVDESDLDFEEEEAPRKRPVRQRSARTAPAVRKTVDEDEDEGEPEPQVSYDDVPSWEEAISYLLNPSMVEATAGDRTSQERGVENRGAERVPERVDRGRPAAERAPRESGPRENGPREGGPREGGSRPPRRGPRRDA